MNTWDKLSMAEKAEVMRLAVAGGVYDLDAIRDGYNEFARGGKIHIAPSKRGTFTAAAKRHGKSVQEFAAQVLAHKDNYSTAMVKKANFARNASKWKHGYGGHIYDGTTEFTQQMNSREESYNGGTIPEVVVTGYAPMRLTTYYPINSKYPYTGHSKLEIPVDTQTFYDYTGQKRDNERVLPYITIDKSSRAEDYNLMTNNCADATLGYLNEAFSTDEHPFLFSTPGDVRDFALEHLNGKLINNYDGSDTVLIPRNANNYKKLSTTALDTYEKVSPGTASVSYKLPYRHIVDERKPIYPVHYRDKKYRANVRGNGGLLDYLQHVDWKHIYDGTTEPTNQMEIQMPVHYNEADATRVVEKPMTLEPLKMSGWEDAALGRAKQGNVYSNYDEAKDAPLGWINTRFRNALRFFQDKGLNPLGSGVSNCTLTASQWVDPLNPIKNAESIVKNPEKYNYAPIDSTETVPGNVLISRNPNDNTYHTMLITGFAGQDSIVNFDGKSYNVKKGEPLLTYSRGGHDQSFLRRNIPISAYTPNSDGKTENHFFRYNYPREVFLPEVTVFGNKRK